MQVIDTTFVYYLTFCVLKALPAYQIIKKGDKEVEL